MDHQFTKAASNSPHKQLVKPKNNATFMTNVKEEHVESTPEGGGARDEKLGEGKPSYIEIHNHLNDMIDGFDQQVEQVIQKQEFDFLSAYRKHMQRVQKDLEQLKKRLNEQDYLMRRSDRIAALETEVQWYREESLVQSKTIAHMKEEAKKCRMQAEDAQNQAAELQAVVNKYQRKAKLLKAALSKTQSECAQLAQCQTASGSLMLKDNSMMIKDLDFKTVGDAVQEINNETILKPSYSKLSKTEKDQLYRMVEKGDILKRQWLTSNVANPQKPSITSFDLMKQLVELYHQNDKQRLIYEISKIVDLKCDNLSLRISELAHENKQLKDEYVNNKRDLLSRYGDATNINPIQQAFVDCIDSVKKQIEKRRYIQTKSVPYDKEGGVIDMKEVKRPLPDKFMSLEQFSAQDKQVVIDLVFEHPDILKGLYQLMFWQKRRQEGGVFSQTTQSQGQDLYNRFMTETLRMYDLQENPFSSSKVAADLDTMNLQILQKQEKLLTSGMHLIKNQFLSSSTLASPMNIHQAATATYDEVEPLDFLKKMEDQSQKRPPNSVFGHFDSFVKQKQIPLSMTAIQQNNNQTATSNKFSVSRYPLGFKNGLQVEGTESFIKLQKQRPMSSVMNSVHPSSASNQNRPTTASLFKQGKRSSLTRFQRPCTRQSDGSGIFKNSHINNRPMTGSTSPAALTNLNKYIRHVRASSQQVPSPKQIDRKLKKKIEGVADLMLDEDFEECFMSSSNINIIHTNNVNIKQVVSSNDRI